MVAWEENGQGYFTFQQVNEHEAVEKMVSEFGEDQREKVRQYFYKVFSKHMFAWSEERMLRDYGLKNLVKVTWNKEDQCFQAYYKNGDWWHYTLDGKWY